MENVENVEANEVMKKTGKMGYTGMPESSLNGHCFTLLLSLVISVITKILQGLPQGRCTGEMCHPQALDGPAQIGEKQHARGNSHCSTHCPSGKNIT